MYLLRICRANSPRILWVRSIAKSRQSTTRISKTSSIVFRIYSLKELGTCRDFKAKLDLANARPVQSQCHQIPFAMESLLDEKLVASRLKWYRAYRNLIAHHYREEKERQIPSVDFSTGFNNAIMDNKHLLLSIERSCQNWMVIASSTYWISVTRSSNWRLTRLIVT